MSGEPPITLSGNLTADPTVRYTQSGTPAANFTVAVTPRMFDRQSNSWRDGETAFYNCVAWREMAENIGETLHKGTRVIVHGNHKARTFETREGEKRTVWEVEVEDIGPSLWRATATIAKTTGGGKNRGSSSDDAQGKSGDDPWD